MFSKNNLIHVFVIQYIYIFKSYVFYREGASDEPRGFAKKKYIIKKKWNEEK
jgi:hypothetical protein